MTEGRKQVPKRPISAYFPEALLIAAASALGYLVAYFYQLGYADAYDFPRAWISISATEIVIAATLVLAFLAGVCAVAYMIFRLTPNRWSSDLTIIGIGFGPVILLVFAGLYYSPEGWMGWLFPLALLVLYLALAQGWRWMRSRRAGQPQQVPGAKAVAIGAKETIDVLMEHKGLAFYFVLLYLSVLPMIAYAAGKGKATNQVQYLVDSERPNVVVLRQYGDLLIMHSYDAKKHILTGSFILKRLGPGRSVTLRYEDIGPLKTPKSDVK